MSEENSSPTYEKGKLYVIKCDELQPNPDQPRKFFEEEPLQALATSFNKLGVFTPILFGMDEGKLIVIAGERRLRAAKEAGLETISAIFTEGKFSEIALVENTMRQDLTAIELAEALQRVHEDYDYSQDELAAIIGKSKSTVSEILSLNDLPPEIRDECRNDPSISRATLLKIVKKNNPKTMIAAYEKYKEKQVSNAKIRGRRKTWSQRFISKYEDLTVLMTNVDIKKLQNTERTDILARVEELKKIADSLIAKISVISDTKQELK